MKKFVFYCAVALTGMSSLATAQDHSSLSAKFAELEAHAPKGFPTLFVVASANRSPGQILGPNGSCAMDLETLGKIYDVYAEDTFHECVVLPPKTMVWGHDHHLIGGEVIDLLDTTGSKAKSLRYFVRNVIFVDPDKQ